MGRYNHKYTERYEKSSNPAAQLGAGILIFISLLIMFALKEVMWALSSSPSSKRIATASAPSPTPVPSPKKERYVHPDWRDKEKKTSPVSQAPAASSEVESLSEREIRQLRRVLEEREREYRENSNKQLDRRDF